MRILITGASGQLGPYLIDEVLRRGHEPIAWSGSDPGSRSGVPLKPLDLTDETVVLSTLDATAPDLIVHAAAISSADAVRSDLDRARRINVGATRTLVDWSDRRKSRIVFTSTDLVFDGSKSWNREDDPPRPLLAYGRTKLDAEGLVLASPSGLVARLPLLFGPSKSGRGDFFSKAIEALRAGEPRTFFEDEYRTPLDFATAARLLVELGELGPSGLVHVAGAERVSRFELMRLSAGALGLDTGLVRPGRVADVGWAEPRPVDVSMATDRLMAWLPGAIRPSIEGALRG